MATLPPVNLGVILFLSFLAAWASRKPIERLVVLPATPISQPKRQFIMDLSLCLIAGRASLQYTISGGPTVRLRLLHRLQQENAKYAGDVRRRYRKGGQHTLAMARIRDKLLDRD